MKPSVWLAPFALGVLCALLWWRAPAGGVGELEPAELLVREKPAEQIAGLSITLDGKASVRYARVKGQWRCLDAHGALADEQAVEALLRASFETRGIRLPGMSGTRFPDPPAWKLELQGPKLLERADRHVLLALELGPGFEAPSSHAQWARLGAEPERILDIDTDLSRLVRPLEGGLPPLLDPRLGAGCFAPQFRFFRRFFFDYADGTSFEVRSTPRADDPARLDWTLQSGGDSKAAIEWRAGGYGGIWIRAKAIGFASRKRLAELGLDPPWLTMVAQPDAGAPLSIRAARLSPAREAWIFNETSGLLMQVEPGLLEQILAEGAMFTDASRPNPFERWLRR